MKKLFVQLLQWIFKYRKKLIYGIFALFVGQICFFNVWWIWVQNQVFATSTENAEQRQQFEKIISEKNKMLDFFRKSVYVLVYPIMFLAGKLVDNSFVYWEVFNFDVVLWKLWNIVRNLANYGLWFLFIYYIFRYLISWDKKKDPKWIIIRALVAWIWIQASWFIMAVLLDISTILIYWVWGLPISVLWWDVSTETKADQNYDPYVMKTIVSVDADDILNMNVYLTNLPVEDEGQKIVYISECDTFSFEYSDGQKLSEEFILAPKMVYYKDEKKTGNKWGNYYKTEKLMCDYYGSVYWFESMIPELEKVWSKGWEGCSGDKDCKDKQSEYDWKKNEVKNSIIKGWSDELNKYIDKQVLKFWKVVSDPHVWLDKDNNWINKEYKTQQLHDVIKKQDTKSYVWVFTSLYTSLLEAWRWMMPVQGKDTYVTFLGYLLALWHVLAIAIPMLAALFVLVMRIWILWVAIALSPMIVLLTAFGFSEKFGDKSFLKYFKFENLVWIIFAPAVICFAVSMSTVLVRIIEKISYEEVLTEPLVFGWVIQMDIAWFSVGLWQLIVWIMWVAVSWFLVWMAVQSSKLWESGFVQSLKGLATDALWAVKFIPVMWKDGQWQLASVNALKNVYEKKRDEIKSEFRTGDTKAVSELFDRSGERAKAAERMEQSTVQDFVGWLKKAENITAGWMNWIKVTVDWKEETMKFNDFEWAMQKKIIQKINWDKEVSEKVWSVTSKITIKVDGKDEVYEFNKEKKEFKMMNTQ